MNRTLVIAQDKTTLKASSRPQQGFLIMNIANNPAVEKFANYMHVSVPNRGFLL